MHKYWEFFGVHKETLDMNILTSILEILLMQSATKLRFGSIVGFVIGILTMTGHLDASSKDLNTTSGDITTAISGFLTLLSAFYFFEHSLLEVKDDLKHLVWVDKPEVVSTPEPVEPIVPETPAV